MCWLYVLLAPALRAPQGAASSVGEAPAAPALSGVCGALGAEQNKAAKMGLSKTKQGCGEGAGAAAAAGSGGLGCAARGCSRGEPGGAAGRMGMKRKWPKGFVAFAVSCFFRCS